MKSSFRPTALLALLGAAGVLTALAAVTLLFALPAAAHVEEQATETSAPQAVSNSTFTLEFRSITKISATVRVDVKTAGGAYLRWREAGTSTWTEELASPSHMVGHSDSSLTLTDKTKYEVEVASDTVYTSNKLSATFWTRPNDQDWTIASINSPWGIAEDGTNVWISDTEDEDVLAYNFTSKARASGKDISNSTLAPSSTEVPYGLFTDGDYLWVATPFGADTIYAFDLSGTAPARSTGNDLEPAEGSLITNGNAVWVSSDYYYMLDTFTKKIFAFDRSNDANDSGADITLHTDNANPQGIWSDGTVIWVADSSDDFIYAYTLADGTRYPESDIQLDHANADPRGLWSPDGEVLWVVDKSDDKVYAYYLPLTPLVGTLDEIDLRKLTKTSANVRVTVDENSDVHFRWREAGTSTWTTEATGRGISSSSLYTLSSLTDRTKYEMEAAADSDFTTSKIADSFWTRPNDQDWTPSSAGGPWGIAADSSHIWISDTDDEDILAYNFADKTRATGKDISDVDLISAGYGTPNPYGLYTDGSYLWIADEEHSSATIIAFDLSGASPTHSSSNDLATDQLNGLNLDRVAVWANTGHFYVLDGVDKKIYAYDRSNSNAYDSSADITLHADNANPAGIWSNGATMWVADSTDERLYAYNLASGARDAESEFRLGLGFPLGLWSPDEDVLWVVDGSTEEVHAYYLPATAVTGSADSVSVAYDQAGRADITATVSVSSADGLTNVRLRHRVKDTTEWSSGPSVKPGAGNMSPTLDLTGLLAVNFEHEIEVSTDPAFPSGSTAKTTFYHRPSYADWTIPASANNRPTGIWGNDDIIWVSEDDTGSGNKIFAYRRADFTHDSSQDFNTLAPDPPDNRNPRGIWSDGTTMFVVDLEDEKVYSYDLKSKAYDTSFGTGISGNAGNNWGAQGIWGNDAYFWIVSDTAVAGTNKIYGFDRSTNSADTTKDFTTLEAAGNDWPSGLWSDGMTMWVLDLQDDLVYAYKMSDMSRDSDKDIKLRTGTAETGLWSDGSLMYVVDSDDNELHAYALPQDFAISEVKLKGTDAFRALVRGNPFRQEFYMRYRETGNTNWINSGQAFSGAGYVDLTHGGLTANTSYDVEVSLDSTFPATETFSTTVLAATGSADSLSVAYDVEGRADITATVGISDVDTLTTVHLRHRAKGAADWTMGPTVNPTTGATSDTLDLTGLLAVNLEHEIEVSTNGDFPADSTVSADFWHRPAYADFNFDSGNTGASGIWGNEDFVWVSNDTSSPNNKIFAYDRSTYTHASSQDFNTIDGAANDNPRGICSDGFTMFVADREDEQVYAYILSNKARDSGKDITLGTSVAGSQGAWCDSTHVWAVNDADGANNKMFAYKRADGTRDSAKDFDELHQTTETDGTKNNSNPRGAWSDGTTMFVVDQEDSKIYAYKTSDESEDSAENILLMADNAAAEGLWSDGSLIWVVDDGDDKAYAYALSEDLEISEIKIRRADRNSATVRAVMKGNPFRQDFHLRYRATGETTWLSPVLMASGATYADFTISGLTPNAKYDVEVSLNSTFGETDDISAVISARPAQHDFYPYDRSGIYLAITGHGDKLYAGFNSAISGNVAGAIESYDKQSKAFVEVVLTAAQIKAATSSTPGSLWTDGTHIWGSSNLYDSVPALKLSDGTVDATPGIPDASLTGQNNDSPTGIWASATTMYVLDNVDDHIYAYNRSTDAFDDDKDFALHTDNAVPWGIWSDGATLWVTDSTNNRVYAYSLADGTRVEDSEIVADAENASLLDIHSDGDVLWVMDSSDDKAYAYFLQGSGVPVTIEAGADVTEGQAATFTLTRDGDDNTAALTVNVSVTDHDGAASFISGTAPTSVTIAANSDTATLSVPTDNDNVVEGDGTITATIVIGDDYVPSSPSSDTVTVNDNDTATWAFTPSTFTLNEGGGTVTVHLGIINSVIFAEAQTVDLLIDGSALSAISDILGGTDGDQVAALIETGASFQLFAVDNDIRSQAADRKTYSLTATLNGAQIGNTANLVVIDDEGVPELTLAAASTEIAEGTDITLTATLDPPYGEAVSVTLGHTDNSSVLTGTVPTSLAFAASTLTSSVTTATATITTDNDTTEEDDANVVFSLSSPTSPVTLGSPSSITVKVLDNDGPPTAPLNLTAAAGDGKVTLRWDAASSETNPVQKYQYRARPSSSGTWAPDWTDVTGGDAARSQEVTGLTNARNYTFEVRAVNATGNGDAASVESRPFGKPGKPSVTVQNRPESLYVSWTVPNDGGNPTTEYEVQWAEDGQSFSTANQHAGLTSRNTLIEGLINHTDYDVRVRAMNLSGWGDWSDPVQGTPTPRPPPSVSITATVSEPVTAPFRVTITFTDQDLDGNDTDGVTGFEADEIIAWYTSRGNATYEFFLTDFRVETPGWVYSALVDKIIDGKLWIEVEEDSAQSSLDGQGNTLSYRTWQVDAPDPAPVPEGSAIWTDTLTVGGQYPDGYGLDGKDTGTKGYFKGWSPASTNDVRYGALPGANFTYGGESYEVLELSHTASWRVVRLRMCPLLQGANRNVELRLGNKWVTFDPRNYSAFEFSRTKDGSVQQCREYDWDQVTLDWQYGQSVNVRITR